MTRKAELRTLIPVCPDRGHRLLDPHSTSWIQRNLCLGEGTSKNEVIDTGDDLPWQAVAIP
jgi:hypothetical protein